VVSREPDRIRLGWPELGAAELAAVEAVLADGMLTMGPRVGQFEAALAEACGVDHAVAVSSGTAALHLVVLALLQEGRLAPGDDVLVPAYTFPATANVLALAGLRPVLVDVDAETMNIDPARIQVGPKTRAVMVVDLFGRPARYEELPDGLIVIEDAAGALGARHAGRLCGSFGVAGCLSFHPRKIVTTGEGGAVTTSDPELAAAVRQLANHGWKTLAPPDMPVLLPAADEGDTHGWQAYVTQVDDRDRVLAALRAQGIEAQIGTYALQQLGAYRDQGAFPGAARVFERALALPFHTRLTGHDLDRVAAALGRLLI
jgi:perosamine synthetase